MANADGGANLQAAINLSVPGDQVWVAAGTYRPTATLNRSIAFAMRNGIEIYRSFQATETLLSERSLANGPTCILSGGIGAAGIADNSYHVISRAQTDTPFGALQGSTAKEVTRFHECDQAPILSPKTNMSK
jgi:hypothetical protein